MSDQAGPEDYLEALANDIRAGKSVVTGFEMSALDDAGKGTLTMSWSESEVVAIQIEGDVEIAGSLKLDIKKSETIS